MPELVYRLLLMLYPPAFRRRYGWQMLEDFREMRRQGGRNRTAVLDVLRTAPRQWVHSRGSPDRGAGPRGRGPVDRIGDGLRELRRAVRALARAPGYSLVVVLTLAVGIGASTAVFSWTEGLVLRPLPAVEDVEHLYSVQVRALDGRDDAPAVSYPDLADLRDGLASRARLAAFGYGRFRIDGTEIDSTDPSPGAWGVFVTGDYFPVLGIRPLVGRLLTPDDGLAGSPSRVAVISESLWTRRFGRDARVVGRTVRIDGTDVQVVGVTPWDFAGTTVGLRLDVWLPVEAAPELWRDEGLVGDRGRRWLHALGRFDPGITLAVAASEAAAVWARIRAEHPAGQDLTTAVVPLDIGVAARLRPLLVILLGITGLMLVAICTNVANLTLLRGAKHDHEVAVLLALGADRREVAAKVLLESAVLATVGVAAGVGLASLGGGLLPSLLPPSTLPLELSAPLDVRVLAFSAGVGAATALLFGSAPALRAMRTMPLAALRASRDDGRGSAAQSTVLMVLQLALSLGTLVTAGFFVHRLDQLSELDRGFSDPEDVVLFPVEMTDSELRSAGEVGALHRLAADVGRLSRVESATFASLVPLGFEGYRYLTVAVAGDSGGPDTPGQVMVSMVGDRYFDVMRVPIRAGRALDGSDRRGTTLAIVVNEAFVRTHMEGSDPIGRGVTIGGREAVVVGVAADGKYRFDQLTEPSPPFVFLAWDQWDPVPATLLVRSPAHDATITAAVRRAFAVDLPDALLLGPLKLDDYTSVALLPVRLGASVLGALGTLATVLAALGLYAIMAFRVTQRTREVGIRVAVGAGRAQVVGLFLRQGAATAGVGLILGLPLGYGIQRTFETLIPQFESGGPVVYMEAAALLLLVALSAVGLAALRASFILPAEALRTE